MLLPLKIRYLSNQKVYRNKHHEMPQSVRRADLAAEASAITEKKTRRLGFR
jgi:hypothetical protein